LDFGKEALFESEIEIAGYNQLHENKICRLPVHQRQINIMSIRL
jgi:hypothetical protein